MPTQHFHNVWFTCPRVKFKDPVVHPVSILPYDQPLLLQIPRDDGEDKKFLLDFWKNEENIKFNGWDASAPIETPRELLECAVLGGPEEWNPSGGEVKIYLIIVETNKMTGDEIRELNRIGVASLAIEREPDVAYTSDGKKCTALDANLEIHLDKAYRNKKYGTLVSRMLLEFAFASFNSETSGDEKTQYIHSVESVTIRTREDNKGMLKLMENWKEDLAWREKKADSDEEWFLKGISGKEWFLLRDEFTDRHIRLWGEHPAHFKGCPHPTYHDNPNGLGYTPQSCL